MTLSAFLDFATTAAWLPARAAGFLFPLMLPGIVWCLAAELVAFGRRWSRLGEKRAELDGNDWREFRQPLMRTIIVLAIVAFGATLAPALEGRLVAAFLGIASSYLLLAAAAVLSAFTAYCVRTYTNAAWRPVEYRVR